MAARIMSLTMSKGSIPKTATALNVGINLARRGKRVLMVDIDPQANLTLGLGVNPGKSEVALNRLEEQLHVLPPERGMKRGYFQERIPEYSVLEVLLNTEKNPSFAIMQTKDGVALIPARFDLAFAEVKLAGQPGCELLLREALSHVKDSYDYIIIDSPSTPGLLAVNAMMAATSLIIPIQTHGCMYTLLPVLYSMLRRIRKHNPILDVGGIVLTMYDARTNLSSLFALRVRGEYALSLHFLVV